MLSILIQNRVPSVHMVEPPDPILEILGLDSTFKQVYCHLQNSLSENEEISNFR